MRKHYVTLSEAISGLKNDGYTLDLNINEDCVICHETGVALSPDEFEIDLVYRFEGATNPDDQSILYAISSKTSSLKGVLVNGYGISSDGATDKLISRLSTHTSFTRDDIGPAHEFGSSFSSSRNPTVKS